MSGISVDKRRQLAATLGLFSVLFIAVGTVAATGASTGVVKAFVVIALLVAVLLALMAWGVARSVKIDLADEHLDAVIDEAVQTAGGSRCGCGHEHDPDELHVTDDPCEQDGAGHDCTHTCDTCVLARLRPGAETVGAGRSPAGRGAAGSGRAAASADDRAAARAGMRPSPTRTREQRLNPS
jgi:hypothetical protein